MGRKRSKLSLIEKEHLQNLVDNSSTKREILVKLGLSLGGAYPTLLNEKIKEHGICITKFLERGRDAQKKRMKELNKGLKLSNIEAFCENSSYTNSSSLKKRLISDYKVKYECQKCKNKGIHEGEKLTLQLDHINGVNNDNRIENLRLLCPNCHSQTSTFAGRGKAKKPIQLNYECQECGSRKRYYSKKGRCIKCSRRKKEKLKAGADEIIQKIKETNYSKAGLFFGVSDNALRKRLKKEGYNLKTLEKPTNEE